MKHLKILHEMTSQCAKVTPQCRQRRSIFTAEFRGLSVLISSLNELVTDLINYTFPCPGMPKCLHRDGAFFLFFSCDHWQRRTINYPLDRLQRTDKIQLLSQSAAAAAAAYLRTMWQLEQLNEYPPTTHISPECTRAW